MFITFSQLNVIRREIIVSVDFSNLEPELILLTETAGDGLRTERINAGVHYRRLETCCAGVNDLICPDFDSVREPRVGDWSLPPQMFINPLHRLIRGFSDYCCPLTL